MGFGDRGRYKAVATSFYELLPQLNPSIERMTGGAALPKESVVLTVDDDGWRQLVWLDRGTWRTAKLLNLGLMQPDWRMGPAHDGPPKAELPARWVLAHIHRGLSEELSTEPFYTDDSVELRRNMKRALLIQVQRVLLT